MYECSMFNLTCLSSILYIALQSQNKNIMLCQGPYFHTHQSLWVFSSCTALNPCPNPLSFGYFLVFTISCLWFDLCNMIFDRNHWKCQYKKTVHLLIQALSSVATEALMKPWIECAIRTEKCMKVALKKLFYVLDAC